jgi:hypothetical protein
MMSEIDLYGIFLPGLLVFSLVAAAATALLRRLLLSIGFYRFVWHPSLFDLALFVLILGVVFVLFHGAGADTLPILQAF